MKLFPGTNAHVFHFAARGQRLGHLDQFHAGNFWHEDFPAMHSFKAVHHESDSLLERYPETGHARIGNRDLAALALLQKNGNHAPAATNYVAVTSTTESRLL